ncbi:splicing factor, arginine/serine-rich 19-like isoform X2 [Artemia franciscana]|uniref:splicing factor, arginine/serine-rich 19-like isoform X1 n=1 Tax=Artemia franciscana TaxID=6661 RepID=UPI0032D9F4C2
MLKKLMTNHSELPTLALIKLTRQEQIAEQVKTVLKQHYRKKKINKEEYKDIMKRAVGKILQSKASSINPSKVEALVTGYVRYEIYEGNPRTKEV